MHRNVEIPGSVKTIVVPVDFSYTSLAGIARAREMALHHHARVILLNVLQHQEGIEETSMGESWNSDEERIERIQDRLRELARRELGAGIHSQIVVTRHRNVETAIADYAKAVRADVIIIGTHGADMSHHPMLVSLSDQISHDADCPVLVVSSKKRSSAVT